MHFDLVEIIKAAGMFGVWAIVFAESGLLFGFFLPGDSLLFTAGFLASQDFFNVHVLAIGCFIAAVAGDNMGYYTGDKFGKRLFERKDSRFFKKEYLEKAKAFYEKHGGKAIILARFVPIVRTFIPIIAGTVDMNYKTFFTYNLVGGLIWGVGMVYAGYFLGRIIPDVDKYLLPIILLIIIVSLLPTFKHILDEVPPRVMWAKLMEVIKGKK